jgi:hypothetical protein
MKNRASIQVAFQMIGGDTDVSPRFFDRPTTNVRTPRTGAGFVSIRG